MKTRPVKGERHEVIVSPEYFARLGEEASPWFENEEEIEAGLEWGRKKARLLRWVRLQAGRRLTPRERYCVEQYFFQGLSLSTIAAATGSHPSCVHRALRRSIRRLQEAARKARFRENPAEAAPRKTRR